MTVSNESRKECAGKKGPPFLVDPIEPLAPNRKENLGGHFT